MRFLLIINFAFLLTGGAVDITEREDIQRIDIIEGETLSLTCKARPTLLRSYRWVYIRKGTRKPRVLSSGRRLVVGEPRLSIDAVPGEGHVNLVLNLKEIRPYEAGLFMCWRQGLKPDPQVYVRVTEKGMEEAEPISIEISAPSHVDYGSPVSVKCLVRPSWPGKVLWLRNDEKILSTDRVYTQHVEEKPNGELLASLDMVSIREGANYTCRVPSTPEAEASFSLTVRVAKIEKLTVEPSKDVIEYGQRLALECVVSGTDSKVLWLKDGNNLIVDDENIKPKKTDEVLDSGNMMSTLLIENFSLNDNGQYVCYVPGDTKGFLINIEGRLPRVTGIKGWDFVVGEVLRLTCSTQYAKGDKKVTWLFQGEPLRTNWWAEEVRREDIHNVTHHDLSLPIPTRAHAGTYTCTTPYGSASTVVREIVPPYVEEFPPDHIDVPLGEQLSLPCSVVGYPIPTVLWEKNINGQWKIVEEAETEGDAEVEGFVVKTESMIEGKKRVGERQELILDESFPVHAGKYRCRGYNEEHSVVVETEVSTSAITSIIEVTADEVLEGDTLKISCSVSNFDGMAKFTTSLRVLGQDGDEKYAVHLLSKEEREKSIQSKTGKSYKVIDKISTYALVISDVSLTDQGFYECHAGSDASGSVEVIVIPLPPEVVEVAASPAVEAGEFFVSCTISNMPTDQKAVFYFDGRNLNDEESSRHSVHLAELTEEVVINAKGRAKQATYVLKVLEASQNDSGVYHCVVGSDARGSTTVTVEALENIEEVYLDATPTWIGGDLVLKCTVINWDKEVSFFLNQTMLLGEEDSRYYLSRKTEGNATIHILNIFDATAQDSGFYQCFTSPITSAEVNVTVKSLSTLAIELKQLPKDEPLWVQSDLIIDCRLQGFKDYTHTIEFSHDGRPYLYLDPTITGPQVNARASFLDDEHEIPLLEEELSYRMKLIGIEKSDGGTWICRATIPEAGFVREAFVDIAIYEPPRFTESPDSKISVEYSSDLILNCVASGYPFPEVAWYKRGIDGVLVNATGSARLELNDFRENDTGVYICEANTLDQFISSETMLDIIKEIKIIEMPDPETIITEGSRAVLRCMALSFPPSENPFVTWSKKDSEETLASGYEIASYIIENPDDSDAGEYVCKAATTTIQKTFSTYVSIVKTSSLSPTPTSTSAPTLMAGRLVEISGPNTVEEGEDIELMCLVSPLLAYYKYILVFNENILTYDGDLVSNDPRMSVKTGNGAVGERLLRLTISNARPEDEGNYECTINTSPIARHTHFVAVVPSGTETADPEETSGYGTSQETKNSSGDATDFWDTTQPFIFTGGSSSDIATTSLTTERIYVPGEKLIKKTVLSERTAVLPCTIQVDEEVPIAWKINENDFFLFVDTENIPKDKRYELDAPDKFTRNLLIHKANIYDSKSYTCLKESDPRIEIHFELTVIEGFKPPTTEDDITESVTETIISPSETDTPDEGILVTEEDVSEETLKGEREPEVSETDCTESSELDTKDEDDEEKYDFEELEDISDLFFNISKETSDEDEARVSTTTRYEDYIRQAVDEDHTLETTDVTETQDTDDQEDKELTDDTEDVTETSDIIAEVETVSTRDESEVTEGRKDLFEEEIDSSAEPETSDVDTMPTKETTAVADKYEDHVPSTSNETFDVVEPDFDVYDVEKTEKSSDDLGKEDDTEHVHETTTTITSDEILPDAVTKSVPVDEEVTTLKAVEEDEKENETITVLLIEDKDEESKEDLDEDEDVEDIATGKDVEEEDIDKDKDVEEEDIDKDKDVEEEDIDKDKDVEEEDIDKDKDVEEEDIDKDKDVEEEDTDKDKDVEEEDIDKDKDEKQDVDKDKDTKEDEDKDKDTKGDEDIDKDEDVDEDEDQEEKDDLHPTTQKSVDKKYPIIRAKPGEDVQAPPEAEVVLPCPTKAVPEDITWKDSEKLLFLGSLDLAGVKGISLSPEGELRLMSGVQETKNDKTYTCLVFDYDTYEDIPVMSYYVQLGKEITEDKHEHNLDETAAGTTHSPTSTYEFPGLEWQEVAIISNSHISGQSLTEVLQEGGINAILVSNSSCRKSSEVTGWDDAHSALKECESNARSSGLLRDSQSVFFILDFMVSLGHEKFYGSTLIYVHNVAVNLTAHVYGPLVPLSMENGYSEIECGSPVYSSQNQAMDLDVFCKSSVASTILTLQEAYLSKSRKLPMV